MRAAPWPVAPFGQTPDGCGASLARLSWAGGIEAEILDYGAIVRSLTIPAEEGRIGTALGFPDLAGYLGDRFYQGCVVGRCANRIAGAAFEIDGEAFAVTANEEANCLHGGTRGFSRRLWRFEAASERAAALTYESPDGEEGFPGAVTARVAFTLSGPDVLDIVWEAEASRPTPVNLTHHLYFNLSGGLATSVLDHELMIAADGFTPVRPDLIPTGEVASVDGTPFDLRRPLALRQGLAGSYPQLQAGGGYDHNWALRPGASPALTLRSPETGVVLSLETDQPGVQIYSGQGLPAPFGPHGGIAIEPQAFPDALHHPGFPDVVLRPGSTYRRSARYRFSIE